MFRSITVCFISLFTLYFIAAAFPPQTLPADFPKGSNVSITGDNLASILPQFSEQSGIKFSFSAHSGAAANPALNLNLHDVPLWDAVRQAQELLGPKGTILWDFRTNPGRTQRGCYPFSNAGPFAVCLSNITHNIDYGKPETQAEVFYVGVMLLTDNSTRIVCLNQSANPTIALDDAGASLVSIRPAPNNLIMVSDRGGGGGFFTEIAHILLQQPRTKSTTRPAIASGRTLKLLEGSYPVTVATKIDSLRMGFPGREERDYGPVHATIDCTISPPGRPGAGQLDAHVTFRRPPGISDDEWDRTAKVFAATRVRLLGPDGSQITTQAGGESTTAELRGVTVLFSRPANTPSPQVLIEIPAETRMVNIPYRFENLALP